MEHSANFHYYPLTAQDPQLRQLLLEPALLDQFTERAGVFKRLVESVRSGFLRSDRLPKIFLNEASTF